MEQFLDKVAAINDVINTFVWVKIGIIILLGVGIVTTVCTKFFQLSHLGLWWKNTIGSLFRKHVIGHTKDKGAISPFRRSAPHSLQRSALVISPEFPPLSA